MKNKHITTLLLILLFFAEHCDIFGQTDRSDVTFNPINCTTNTWLCKEEPWVLIFEDEFNGDSLNSDLWNISTGVVRDPYFTKQQSNDRYVGWIRDEIERGTDFYKLIFKGEEAGFFGLKQMRPGVLFPFLAGLYPEGPKALGLGYVLCYHEIIKAAENGAKTITGAVSSNNIPSLAALTAYGYTVDGAVSVFVKHKND